MHTSSPPWTTEQKDRCLKRGCHPSATEHAEFLRDEMAEFIENRFWAVLPYDLVRDLEDLFASPAAVKDERDRKPRLLCDHSWPWEWHSVNETTLAHAPPEAMQFGGTLPRLLYLARHQNPKFGPLKGAKHDLKDGFYRMFLDLLHCLRLAVLLPEYAGEPRLIAIPMSCTMGWVQSPPTFCAMSETIADRSNLRFKGSPTACPKHRLSEAAEKMDDTSSSTEPRPREPEHTSAEATLRKVAGLPPANPCPEERAPPSNRPLSRAVGHTDLFVDDFIQLGQGRPKRLRVLRDHLLHSVDEVLSQPLPEETRTEAISLKKLLRGDGSWATRKELLGWILDFVRQTIELPAHRKESLAQVFTELQGRTRVSVNNWQRYLGKLRFVAQAIPGATGLFCTLQMALNKASDGRVRIT